MRSEPECSFRIKCSIFAETLHVLMWFSAVSGVSVRTAGVGETGEGGGEGGVGLCGGAAAAQAAHKLQPRSLRLRIRLGAAAKERPYRVGDGPAQSPALKYSKLLCCAFVLSSLSCSRAVHVTP